MHKILIIEDDKAIARLEKDFLEINDFTVTIQYDGKDGMDEALTNTYDLILLDVMLPTGDGYTILREIRSKIRASIVMVTAKEDEVDMIRGLGLGADDYIAKPFSPSELVARVKSNIAQYERLKSTIPSEIAPTEEMKISDITINPKTMKVFVGNREVLLKNKEFELLLFLMQNPQIVFSKNDLYEKIWGMDAFGDIRTVSVHIKRIREKIENDPANPKHILTNWGTGYHFEP